MEQIGYSLIDANDNELTAFGNTKGVLYGLPSLIVLPNGDQVHCAKVSDVFTNGERLVERWIDDSPASKWFSATGRSIAFDGTKIIVTVEYETTPSIVPGLITPRQARLALLGAGLLDDVEAAVDAAGGATKITWEYATEINRHDVLIAALGGVLGLTAGQIDNLFRTASDL